MSAFRHNNSLETPSLYLIQLRVTQGILEFDEPLFGCRKAAITPCDGWVLLQSANRTLIYGETSAQLIDGKWHVTGGLIYVDGYNEREEDDTIPNKSRSHNPNDECHRPCNRAKVIFNEMAKRILDPVIKLNRNYDAEMRLVSFRQDESLITAKDHFSVPIFH